MDVNGNGPLSANKVATSEETQTFIEDCKKDGSAYWTNLTSVFPGLEGVIKGLKKSVGMEVENWNQPTMMRAFIMTANVAITRDITNSVFEEKDDADFWLRSLLRWSVTPKPFILHLAQLHYAREGRTNVWRRALNYCLNSDFILTDDPEDYKKILVTHYLEDCIALKDSRDYDNDELVQHVAHDIVPAMTQAQFELFCDVMPAVIKRHTDADGLDEDLDFYNKSMSDAGESRGFPFVMVLDV